MSVKICTKPMRGPGIAPGERAQEKAGFIRTRERDLSKISYLKNTQTQVMTSDDAFFFSSFSFSFSSSALGFFAIHASD